MAPRKNRDLQPRINRVMSTTASGEASLNPSTASHEDDAFTRARERRLRALQMDDLGMSRREFVSANLVSEDMDTIDTPLTMQQIEARRKVNQAGTEESNISAAKKNSLSSWNAVWTTLQDDGAVEENLPDFKAGQSHRNRLMEIMANPYRERNEPQSSLQETHRGPRQEDPVVHRLPVGNSSQPKGKTAIATKSRSQQISNTSARVLDHPDVGRAGYKGPLASPQTFFSHPFAQSQPKQNNADHRKTEQSPFHIVNPKAAANPPSVNVSKAASMPAPKEATTKVTNLVDTGSNAISEGAPTMNMKSSNTDDLLSLDIGEFSGLQEPISASRANVYQASASGPVSQVSMAGGPSAVPRQATSVGLIGEHVSRSSFIRCNSGDTSERSASISTVANDFRKMSISDKKATGNTKQTASNTSPVYATKNPFASKTLPVALTRRYSKPSLPDFLVATSGPSDPGAAARAQYGGGQIASTATSSNIPPRVLPVPRRSGGPSLPSWLSESTTSSDPGAAARAQYGGAAVQGEAHAKVSSTPAGPSAPLKPADESSASRDRPFKINSTGFIGRNENVKPGSKK